MRMQNYVADHARSNAGAYGSYKPAVQVGMQPPPAYHTGEGMPAYTHLVQPATAPCMNESALLNGRLLPPTLLTSMKPVHLCRMPRRSRALKKVGLMMTSLERRIRVRARTTPTVVLIWNLCCQWLLLSQLYLVACACSWCRFRCCLVSLAYRRRGSPHLLRWFVALSWGAWRIVPLLILAKSKRREAQKLVLLVAWTSRRGCRGVHTSRGNIPVLSAAMIIIVNGCKMLLVFSITVNLW